MLLHGCRRSCSIVRRQVSVLDQARGFSVCTSQDASDEFNAIHSSKAKAMLDDYLLGELTTDGEPPTGGIYFAEHVPRRPSTACSKDGRATAGALAPGPLPIMAWPHSSKCGCACMGKAWP